MPSAAYAVIQGYLRPGEELIWAERPDPSALAARSSIHLIASILGLIIGALLFAGPFGAPLRTGENFVGDLGAARALSGAAAIFLIAFFIVSLHRFMASWRHYYALTSERALIVTDLWPQRVKTYGYAAFHSMARSGDEQRGTIVFGEDERALVEFWIQGFRLPNRPRFAGISQPKRVEALIQARLRKVT